MKGKKIAIALAIFGTLHDFDQGSSKSKVIDKMIVGVCSAIIPGHPCAIS